MERRAKNRIFLWYSLMVNEYEGNIPKAWEKLIITSCEITFNALDKPNIKCIGLLYKCL